MIIITIGIGSETGATVPMTDETGQIASPKLDGVGEPIISRLNSEILQQIAIVGNGRYLAGDDAAETLPAYLDEIRATHTGSQIIVEPIEHYQLFLLTAVLLLTLSSIALPKNS
jgi:Ca-activated chloride channel family protein